MKLNREDYELFKEALLKNIREDLELPGEFETGVIYQTERFRYESRGHEVLKFFIKENKDGTLSLDYYFTTDDSTNHFRIDHTGNLVMLENYEGQWGWPIYDTEEETKREHERISKHNQEVRKILIAKGFEKALSHE